MKKYSEKYVKSLRTKLERKEAELVELKLNIKRVEADYVDYQRHLSNACAYFNCSPINLAAEVARLITLKEQVVEIAIELGSTCEGDTLPALRRVGKRWHKLCEEARKHTSFHIQSPGPEALLDVIRALDDKITWLNKELTQSRKGLLAGAEYIGALSHARQTV